MVCLLTEKKIILIVAVVVLLYYSINDHKTYSGIERGSLCYGADLFYSFLSTHKFYLQPCCTTIATGNIIFLFYRATIATCLPFFATLGMPTLDDQKS